VQRGLWWREGRAFFVLRQGGFRRGLQGPQGRRERGGECGSVSSLGVGEVGGKRADSIMIH